MMLMAVVLLWSPLPTVVGWSSPDWRTRDAATVLSARFGAGSWAWADTLACPECRVRAERGRRLALSAAMRRLGPYPAADAAWYDPVANQYRAESQNPWLVGTLRAYLDAVGTDSYPHANYRTATRLWVAAALWGGADEQAVGRLLDRMRVADRAYYESKNIPVPWEK